MTDFDSEAYADKIRKDLPMNDHEIGHLFDLDARSVRELARGGIIKRYGRGRYRPREATRGYVSHLREIIWERCGHWA